MKLTDVADTRELVLFDSRGADEQEVVVLVHDLEVVYGCRVAKKSLHLI